MEVAEEEAGQQQEVATVAEDLSRRLTIYDPPLAPSTTDSNADLLLRAPRLLCEEHHDAAGDPANKAADPNGVVLSKWRQKEKLKTTAVALVLCLNIGVDPPDVIKISPCARLECWVDPLSMQPAKALETIGKNLQAQYERWQPRAKYKMHLDPTVDDVKKLCVGQRRSAKNERVLFHYNGHGVPRPTANGELWVFNSRYTQYIPLSIYELHSWLGTPSIYVLDCSAAGLVINSFRSFLDQRQQDVRLGGNQYGAFPGAPGQASGPGGVAGGPADPMREVIVLAACQAHELLPQTPDLPADVFTACLTTPIKVALRWFVSRSLMRHDGITQDLIDRIPGHPTNRKTPLGELNWIFTAITDTIAWNVLPRPLFQKLFRSDLLVASLFRNFLLAERIMSTVGCTPVSYPRLPPTAHHPMWQAWDMAAEMCLMQLPGLLADPTLELTPSSFFSEQLTAFELWLQHGSRDKKPPEQLPIVLQVLLSQIHRLRALVLLGRFLDMGPWAVDLALGVGIFPYVLKLLQTTSADLRSTLVFIWCKVLALDQTCQVDLVKDNGHVYFIRYLDAPIEGPVDFYSRAQAAFVLACICDGHPKGQALCASSQLLAVLLKWLRSTSPLALQHAPAGHHLLLRWLCLTTGKLCEDIPEVSLHAIREGAADILVQLLASPAPEIRAAAIFGLACLIHSCPDGGTWPPELAIAPPTDDRLPAEQLIANAVTQVVYDPSVLVRCELAVLFARFVRGHAAHMREALAVQQRRLEDFAAQARAAASSSSGRPFGEADATGAAGSSSGSGAVGGVGDASGSWSGARGGQAGPRSSGGSGRGSPSGGLYGQQDQRPPSASPAAAVPPPGHPRSAAHSTYLQIAEAITMLALDPSPKVAALGRTALKIAQFELSFTPGVQGLQTIAPAGNGATQAKSMKPRFWRQPFGSAMSSRSAASSAADTSAHGGSVHSVGGGPSSLPGVNAGSVVEGMAGIRRNSVSVTTSAVVGSGAAGSAPSACTSASASPPSPARDLPLTYSRPPYMLRNTTATSATPGSTMHGMSGVAHDHGGGSVFGGASGIGAYGDYADGVVSATTMDGRAHGGMSMLHQAGEGGGGRYGSGSVPLPASLIYQLSKQYFSRPLLEPQASSWRESDGVLQSPWTVPVNLERKNRRRAEIEAGLAVCRNMRTPKLREQVYSIELQQHAEVVTSLCFHPYHPAIVCADARGFLRTYSYGPDGKCLNAFHVANGASLTEARAHPPPAVPVVMMRQINETDGPMLLAGSGDGAVRVWRNYFQSGEQRMATALQSVEIHLIPTLAYPTVYEWSPTQCHLFAAGGKQPDRVYCWDLRREHCHSMLHLYGAPGAGAASAAAPLPPAGVEQLLLSQHDTNMLIPVCSDGTLRVFDLRTAVAPRMVLAPFGRGITTGVVLEPGGRQGVIVAANDKGEMKWLDLRGGTGGVSAEALAAAAPAEVSAACTFRSLQAHTKGGVCVLAGHHVAPLLATGTTTSVVKLWTYDGDVLGTLRPGNSGNLPLLGGHKASPVTCMAFHPYQPLLAAAGSDSCLTLYEMHDPAGASAAAAATYGRAAVFNVPVA